MSLSAACKEAVWLRRLLIGIISSYSSFSDNQSAIKLAWNEGINRRNKHIDVAYYFVRDVVSRGKVYLEYKSTSEMVADTLAKPLK